MSCKKFCAISECNITDINLEKRHYFKFPKEHDRWLQWVKACGRLDLEAKGPQYANQNCYLCHLHFEEKWYKINNIRVRLHPDAIPTKFYRSPLDQNDAVNISNVKDETSTATVQEIEEMEIEEGENKEEQRKEQIEADTQQEKRNESTSSMDESSSIQQTENSPRKRKLRMKIMILKAQNKTLRETIRRFKLQKKKQARNAPKKEEDEHETLRELGNSYVQDKKFE